MFNGTIEDEIRTSAYNICSKHLGGAWAAITPAELSVEPISGGTSNALYYCSIPDSAITSNGEPTQLLLRFYGDQWRNCELSLQLEIFKLLSSLELGPKLYGDFEEGRLEEFLPASSLTNEELVDSEISSIIAKKIACIHRLDVPMNRENTWLKDRLNEWFDYFKNQAKVPEPNGDVVQSTIDIALELMAINFDEEIKFLHGILERTLSPMVFSHNDLHQGNILLAERSKRRPNLEKRLVLIDFEYCSYNYRAYDIANHFCEWSFEYDTPEYPHFVLVKDRFPSKEVQRAFVRSYFEQLRTNTDNASKLVNNSLRVSSCDNNKSFNNCNSTNSHSDGDVYDKNEDALLKELEPFFMAANLLWTLWCIKSANCSNIKFGYWEHAMARWKLYSEFKESYLRQNLDSE